MSSFYTPEEKAFEPAPAGVHAAVFLRIVDHGTQATKYGSKPQAAITWELVDEMMTNGKPFTVTRRYYNVSANQNSAWRKDIEGCLGASLTGQQFSKLDLSELLGRTCSLFIRHETGDNGKVYGNVDKTMPAPKGVAKRMSVAGAVCFSLKTKPFAQDEYDMLPDWEKKIIAESPEFKNAHEMPFDDEPPERPPPHHFNAEEHMGAESELDDVPDWVTESAD